jgi:hypothetical protein
MSIANERSGSLAGVGFEMQAKDSLPVIPLHSPVPPAMIWVPQRRRRDVEVDQLQRAALEDPRRAGLS